MAKKNKSGKSTEKTSKKKSNKAEKKKALKGKSGKSLIKSVKKKETIIKKKTKKTPVKKTAAKKITTKKITAPKKTTVKKVKVPKAKVEKVKEKAVEPPKIRIQDVKGYSKKDLDHFKQIILEKRDEIIEQLQNLKDQMLDPTTGEYINENSPYSLHMAEQGTDAMEREKTFLYAQRENKFLGYLEDALKRIETGTYGICIECIEEPQHLCETCPLVPKARLEAVPHSQLCLPIKQRQEKK
jgi:RNA polymerase-binding transcription factor DksA